MKEIQSRSNKGKEVRLREKDAKLVKDIIKRESIAVRVLEGRQQSGRYRQELERILKQLDSSN